METGTRTNLVPISLDITAPLTGTTLLEILSFPGKKKIGKKD